MVKTYDDVKIEAQRRMRAKTLDSLFTNQLQSEMRIAPFVAKGILSAVYDCYKLKEEVESQKLLPGKIKVMAVDINEPPVKKLSECKMKEIIISLFTPEDQEIRENWAEWQKNNKATYGEQKNITTLLRRYRLLRITCEAHEQGANLTQEELAYNIFGCGLKTIQRDIKAFKENGIIVPTRGQQKDIGRGTTHKGQAIKWFLAGIETKEIGRRMYHSIKSVERYIKAFTKVSFLIEQDYKLPEISFLTGLSYSLSAEYKRIYDAAKAEGKTEIIEDLIKSYGDTLYFIKKRGENE